MRLLIVFCTLAIATSCTRNTRSHRAVTGSCHATCDYYQYCKGEKGQEAAAQTACISECRIIFTEDGEVDEVSLRGLQELECSKLLSFIEGAEGRSLGSQSPGSEELRSEVDKDIPRL